jgi:hypothetical protein
MRSVLRAAGLYNLVWGLFVILFPLAIFAWTGMQPPRYPEIWQCVGMIVGVYGIGYLIAAEDPFRHWPIVLVGLLGKIFGPIGFISAVRSGALPLAWGWTIVTNDLIWWVPFAAILYHCFRHETDTSCGDTVSFWQAITSHKSHRGKTLQQLSEARPTMVVYLRHAGCTFCREALADLGQQRAAMESLGVDLAIVHMSPPMEATVLFSRHGLEGVHRFSDPHCEMYRAFGLPRGSLTALFAPSIWWKGLVAAIWRGHGIGKLAGDGFRMPGVFIISKGRVLAQVRARTAADRPNYLALARSVVRPAESFAASGQKMVAAGV